MAHVVAIGISQFWLTVRECTTDVERSIVLLVKRTENYLSSIRKTFVVTIILVTVLHSSLCL